MTTIYVHQGTTLPKRNDFDFYPTPLSVAQDALGYVPSAIKPTCILDPGAGTGVWGQAARKLWPAATITGVDLRPVPKSPAYNFWFHGDYLLMDAPPCFDLVIGNPPYKYAEQFVKQSFKFLESGGHLIMLLRLNFLESQSRATGLWRTHPLKQAVVCSKRVSFTGDGKTNATAYAYFIWQKGWKGSTELMWSKAA